MGLVFSSVYEVKVFILVPLNREKKVQFIDKKFPLSGAKLLGGILLGGLAVGGAAIFVAVSPIVVPAYFGYRLRQRRRLRRMNNRTVTFDFHDFIDAVERDMIAHGMLADVVT